MSGTLHFLFFLFRSTLTKTQKNQLLFSGKMLTADFFVFGQFDQKTKNENGMNWTKVRIFFQTFADQSEYLSFKTLQLGPEQTICYITGVGPKNLGPTQNLHYSPNEIWSKTKPFFWLVQLVFEYHRRAIISRGLYIFYSIFEDHFFVFKEDFPENSSLM